MNKYLENLVGNFSLLWNFTINLQDLPLSRDANYQKSIGDFRNFLKNQNSQISILIMTPQGFVDEDKFYPYGTYESFLKIDQKNKNLLEDFAYSIDELVSNLRKEGIFDKELKHFPETKIKKICDLIADEKEMNKIQNFVYELEKKIKAAPLLKDLWIQDVQLSTLKKNLKIKDAEIASKEVNFERQKVEINVSEDWHQHFEDRVKEIKDEIDKLTLHGKITVLRFLIYLIPLFSAFVGFYAIVTEQKLNVIHYEFTLSAILLISILSYHLKHYLRELNILKHMRSSYRHRAIVAKTFQSLVASDHFKGEKSEIVVKEAALAMFKKEAQGYLSKDQMEPSSTPLQEIVGIFKNK